jgi:hypothetical protein
MTFIVMSKQCSRYKEVKLIDEFSKSKLKKNGFDSYCKKCRCALAMALSRRFKAQKGTVVYLARVEVTEKECSCCKEVKVVTEFSKHKYKKDGLNCYCKACDKKRRVERYNDRGGREWAARYYKAKRNSVKVTAREAVKKAVKNGGLVVEPCMVCGDPQSEAHHSDYTKPLDVDWLCKKHHSLWYMYNQPYNG